MNYIEWTELVLAYGVLVVLVGLAAHVLAKGM